VDVRSVIAERNVEAILDASERLLRRGEQMSFSAVATEAGLSRPTVYAHFENREALLMAVVARTIREAATAVEAASPDQGAPVDALRRVVSASWEHLARHQEVAHGAHGSISHQAIHGVHHEVQMAIGRLIGRGRAQGVFRSDLPVDWLVTSCLAVIHAAAAEVWAGRMSSAAALEILCATVESLCVTPVAAGKRPRR